VLSGKNTKDEDKIAREMVWLFAITVSLLATIHSITVCDGNKKLANSVRKRGQVAGPCMA
jgi:hypothetical protein